MPLTYDISVVQSPGGMKAIQVNLTGDLDSAVVDEFQNVMEKLFDKGGKNFILDCEYLEFMGSAGLAKILNFTDQAEEAEGGLALIRVSKKLRLVIETMGFQSVINVFADQTSALFWLEGKSEADK